MRVALVAPCWYPVPPRGYGGVERVVDLLSKGLRSRGHHVTLLGAEGSTSGDEVHTLAPTALSSQVGAWVHHHTHARRAYRLLADLPVDVVADHTGWEGILAASFARLPAPVVATVHEPVGAAEAAFLAEVDDAVHLVALSASQRRAPVGLRWRATIGNAVDPADLVDDVGDKQGYLVQLARIDPTKGQHLAIDVARRVGLPLVLAGKLDDLPECRAYFERHVAPHLGGDVTWVPEVRAPAKARLLAGATAMLFPVQWEEPFGLAVAEAMANGTPVVALARGALPELVRHGETGFLAHEPDELVAGVGKAAQIDPQRCAALARARFGVDAMVDAYERLYRALVG